MIIKHTLSPVQTAILSTGWTMGVFLVLLVLAKSIDLTLDGPAALGALILLGPIVLAAFSRQLSGVLLGAVGLGAGLLTVDLIAAIFFADFVDWARILILVPLLPLGNLIVGVPLWWSIRRLRCKSAPATLTS